MYTTISLNILTTYICTHVQKICILFETTKSVQSNCVILTLGTQLWFLFAALKNHCNRNVMMHALRLVNHWFICNITMDFIKTKCIVSFCIVPKHSYWVHLCLFGMKIFQLCLLNLSTLKSLGNHDTSAFLLFHSYLYKKKDYNTRPSLHYTV